MNIRIKDLNVGDKCRIIGYKKTNKEYRKRLLTMGLTPKTEFTITRIAPLGDPIEINIRNFSLILRKSEARILILEKIT